MDTMNKYQYLPSLSLEEYEALKESIRENGVIEPVIVDESGAIIDGHHRVKACEELGIECPTLSMKGIPEEQKQNLSVMLNTHRRHLTKLQKIEMAIDLCEQGWTQKRVASALGVAQQTVSAWLKDITKNSNPDQPSPKPAPAEDTEKAELRKQVSYYENLARRLEREKDEKILETNMSNPFSPNLNKDELITLKARAEEAEKQALVLKMQLDEISRNRNAEITRRVEEECSIMRSEIEGQMKLLMPSPEIVEVSVVPPEVRAALEKAKGDLERISSERDKLQDQIEGMKKAGKDYEALRDKMTDLHKSYNLLQKKYDLDAERTKEAALMSNAVREIRAFLEQRKGTIERFSRTGVFSWMLVSAIEEVGALCHEFGDMIMGATRIVSMENQEGETVYVDRKEHCTVEL
jgi:ParB-like chromosome segregation protein Spo0J